MRRSLALALLLAGLLTPTAAVAESETVYDTYDRSAPAQNLEKVRFSHDEDAVVIRITMEHLSKKKTVLVSKYLRRDGATIQVVTKYVRGHKRVAVTGHEDLDPVDGQVDATWDFRKDVVRIEIGEDLLRGRRASFLAWSQEKGAMHGNHFGDTAYVEGLARG